MNVILVLYVGGVLAVLITALEVRLFGRLAATRREVLFMSFLWPVFIAMILYYGAKDRYGH